MLCLQNCRQPRSGMPGAIRGPAHGHGSMEVEHRLCQEIKLLKMKGLLFLVGENVSRNDKRDRQKCSVGGGGYPVGVVCEVGAAPLPNPLPEGRGDRWAETGITELAGSSDGFRLKPCSSRHGQAPSPFRERAGERVGRSGQCQCTRQTPFAGRAPTLQVSTASRRSELAREPHGTAFVREQARSYKSRTALNPSATSESRSRRRSPGAAPPCACCRTGARPGGSPGARSAVPAP